MADERHASPVVHVVDDEEPVRDALVMLLESAGYHSVPYASAEEFLAAVDRAGHGAVIADIKMPGLDGLSMLRRMRAGGASIPLIFITGHGDIPMAVAAIKDGAFDFLEKPFDEEMLLESLRRALSHDRRRRSGNEDRVAARARLAALTPRELEIFDLLVQGATNKSVARRLGISPRTVENHRAHVMDKLQARSLSDLVRIGIHAAAGRDDPPPE
jgi:two-component system response regulator FixJ